MTGKTQGPIRGQYISISLRFYPKYMEFNSIVLVSQHFCSMLCSATYLPIFFLLNSVSKLQASTSKTTNISVTSASCHIDFCSENKIFPLTGSEEALRHPWRHGAAS